MFLNFMTVVFFLTRPPKPPGAEEDQEPVHRCFLRGLLRLQVPEKAACVGQGMVRGMRHRLPQPHGVRGGGVCLLRPGPLLVLAAAVSLRAPAQGPLAAQAPQEGVAPAARTFLLLGGG